jgi:hypothetical protein
MKPIISSLLLVGLCFHQAFSAGEKPAAAAPRTFATPLAAADAFIEALKTGDTPPLLEIFGTEHKDAIGTADPERDRELRGRVAKMATERRRFRINDDESVTMVIGFEAWPFPIPLVKAENGWRFDTAAGIGEVVKRRIGENELSAIAALHAYVDAQRQYASAPRDGTEVRQFAQKLRSTEGKKDGLYWQAKEGEEPSPAGPGIKDASTPHAGYHFKILTSQGAAAPAGKYNYVINGRLIAGFAMVAWPDEYGKSGVMTFVVNHYGDVYQKDLGSKTAALASAMSEFNPDTTWVKLSDETD